MKTVLSCVGLLILVTALEFFMAWCFMSLWNWVVPDLFNGPMLTYWKAFGLMILLSIIGNFFKSSSSKK